MMEPTIEKYPSSFQGSNILLNIPKSSQNSLKEYSILVWGILSLRAYLIPSMASMLWPPHAKSWLIWKDPDAGQDWRWEKKGTTEDEMVEWHCRLNGHEFEPIPGVGDGQGGLACCSPWGHKESDMTEQLNWNEAWSEWFLGFCAIQLNGGKTPIFLISKYSL